MHPRDDAGKPAPGIETYITTDCLDGFGAFTDFGTPADGAVLIFEGRVRETNDGRPVSGLTYEAYGEMAERELSDICHRAADRFEIGSIIAAHRVGELELTEVSVAIGVTAPHRDACYAASRWIIEEIKGRLPIWKHEHYEDGGSHWVGAPPTDVAGAGSPRETP